MGVAQCVKGLKGVNLHGSMSVCDYGHDCMMVSDDGVSLTS